MKKLLTAFALLMLNNGWLMAQNPIIRDQFTADPTARVFNNKVYLYPSHDIVPLVLHGGLSCLLFRESYRLD